MALAPKKYWFAPLPPELAGPDDRAGKYTMEELRAILAPVLGAPAVENAEGKWPVGYGLLVGLLISLSLWAIILFAGASL